MDLDTDRRRNTPEVDEHTNEILLTGGGNNINNSINDDSDKDEEDDDDDSTASSAMSDDGPKPTLLEIREQKMKRNQDLLRSLGLGNLLSNKRTEALEDAVIEPGDVEEKSKGRRRRRGMLLPVQWPAADAPTDLDIRPSASTTNHLYAKYPHRERELKKLLGLLRPLSCDASHAPLPVPAPLFVIGSHGQGKTSVVADAVQALGLLHAFIDCAVLDVPSLEELTRTAYSEFESQLVARRLRQQGLSTPQTRLKKKRKRVMDERSTGGNNDSCRINACKLLCLVSTNNA